MCCFLQRFSPWRGVKRKSGSCWDADCVISAQNDACAQHKAGSDRKDFMKLAGCLASHKVWVGVGQITVLVDSVLCVVCTLASSYRCKCVKGGVGESTRGVEILQKKSWWITDSLLTCHLYIYTTYITYFL